MQPIDYVTARGQEKTLYIDLNDDVEVELTESLDELPENFSGEVISEGFDAISFDGKKANAASLIVRTADGKKYRCQARKLPVTYNEAAKQCKKMAELRQLTKGNTYVLTSIDKKTVNCVKKEVAPVGSTI